MSRTVAALLAGLALLVASGHAEEPGRIAVVFDIKGPIGPAISDYVERGLDTAQDRGAVVVVLRMDTPGGLDTSMREIIQAILESPVPVATFVAPSGARAASAGTYILYASHVAAMAPGTNLGAATPVQIGGMPGAPSPERPGGTGGDGRGGAGKGGSGMGGSGMGGSGMGGTGMGATGDKDDKGDKGDATAGPTRPSASKPTMADKVVSDAAAYIRGLAQMRGRNAEWAVKAVREAASLPAADAVAQNVVDLMAKNIPDLLAKIDGRTVEVRGEDRVLATKGLPTETIAPDWRTELLAVITNPNVAYILMLIGIYGLIFEFTNPGAVVPGVIGGISLLLALYALQVLPVNFAGLALIGLGIILMGVEAAVPGFGILGIGGVAAFAIGSVMLFDSGAEGFELSLFVVAGVATTSAGFFFLILTLAFRARVRPVVSGRESLVGAPAEVLEWKGDSGRVRAQGEIWRATATGRLKRGQRVRVAGIDGLRLRVEDQPPVGEEP